ncbi:MAG: GntR family transcriptional regulator [Burkholderiaceae bacterium]
MSTSRSSAPRRAGRGRSAGSAGSTGSSHGAAPVAPAVHGQRPRYQQVAHELTRAIVDGRYPVGAQLPTEAELCAQFDISRHTAREAVRVLASGGLIVRRQRAGTVVVATPDDARYAHEARSLQDLTQYAKSNQMRLVYIGMLALNKAQARDFGATQGDEWIYATGIRYEGGNERPICVTRLFLNPLLKGIEKKLRESRTAVYALIEKEYGLSIERVDQELQGVVLDVHDAANLGAPAGSPALRIVRRYYDEHDRLLEISDNVHPSDRFTYRISLKK